MVVVIVKIDLNLTQKQFDALLKYVSPEKISRIRKFHFFRDAQNTLVGDVLARMEIGRRTGLSNDQLLFIRSEYGKPFLIDKPRVHFNISHTGTYVTCVIDNEPVGIDIEEIKNIDLKIAERFFAPDEISYILTGNFDLQIKRFFEVWTMKESHIKWEGRGLSKPLPSFSVFSLHDNPKLYYHCVYEDKEVIAYVCTLKREAPTIKMISISELLNYFNIQDK